MSNRTDSDAPTRADVCAVACADVWRDAGEILVSPFGTIPGIGARLALLTFSPDIVLTDGDAALVVGAPPIGAKAADVTLAASLPYRSVFDVVWSGRRHVMMMASQIDKMGNQNIAAVGDWSRPKAQLVGVRGAPGNSVNHPTSYWVPSHSTRSFVEHVDVVCGVGSDSAASAGIGATRFHDLRAVVSNLGVFDFETADRSMRIRSLHPGVSKDEVVAATGFSFDSTTTPEETRLPSDDELALIRNVIDPKGLRGREVEG